MSKSRRIAFDGMLAAVYFALSLLVVDTGSLKFTFTSLAIVAAALLFGTWDACAVAFVGELLYQVIKFGVTATTPIWMLPPVLHALLLGLCALLLGRKRPLAERTVPCFAACMGCALVNSLMNTLALYIDSQYYGYYQYHMVFGLALVRFAVGLGTALLVTAVAIPLVRTLRAKGLVPLPKNKFQRSNTLCLTKKPYNTSMPSPGRAPGRGWPGSRS